MNKNTKTNENKGKLVIEKRVSFVKPIELVLYLYFLSILKRPIFGEPKEKMSGFHQKFPFQKVWRENFPPKSFDIFNDSQRLILVLTNKLLHVKAFL